MQGFQINRIERQARRWKKIKKADIQATINLKGTLHFFTKDYLPNAKAIADFKEGMSKVQSISSTTAEDMELLSRKAKEIFISEKTIERQVIE